MQILICDDDKNYVEKLKNIIDEVYYSKEYECDILSDFNNLKNSISIIVKKYDIFFINASMWSGNGIRFARGIRQRNHKVYIIILAKDDQHALAALDIHAYGYVMKTGDSKKVNNILKQIDQEMDPPKQRFYYKVGRELRNVKIADILYFMKEKRKMVLTARGLTDCFYTSLKEVENNVDVRIFVQINASTIINLQNVKAHTKDSIIMDNGTEFAISDGYKKNFYSRMGQYMELSKDAFEEA